MLSQLQVIRKTAERSHWAGINDAETSIVCVCKCNRGVWWFGANGKTVDVSFNCFIGPQSKVRLDWVHAVSLMNKDTHQSLETGPAAYFKHQVWREKHTFLRFSLHYGAGALCSKLSKLNCVMNIVKTENLIWPMGLNLLAFTVCFLSKDYTWLTPPIADGY